MKAEYDFTDGVRGKYAARYAEGHNLVRIDPMLAEHFPDSDAVNRALKAILEAVGHGKKKRKKA